MTAKKPALKHGAKTTRIFRRHSSAGKTITIIEPASRIPETVRLKDIGMGGLSFDLDRKLRKGAVVYVRAGDGEGCLRIKARVAWVKKNSGNYHIGVSFAGPEYATRARIMGKVLSKRGA